MSLPMRFPPFYRYPYIESEEWRKQVAASAKCTELLPFPFGNGLLYRSAPSLAEKSIKKKNTSALTQSLVIKDPVTWQSLNGKKYLLLKGSSPEPTEEQSIEVPPFGMFRVSQNMLRDILRIKLSINGKEIKKVNAEGVLLDEKELTKNIICMILPFFQSDGRNIQEEVSFLSHLLNGIIGLNLTEQATRHFQQNTFLTQHIPQDRLLLKKDPGFHIQLKISKKEYTLSTALSYSICDSDSPENTIAWAHGEVSHFLQQPSALYKFTPRFGPDLLRSVRAPFQQEDSENDFESDSEDSSWVIL